MSNNVFALQSSSVNFIPEWVPTRFVWNKERTLDREQNFCGHEDVSDLGAKNREVRITGPMKESLIDKFNAVLELNEPFVLVSPAWNGEVRVKDGEIEGPTLSDPHSGEDIYKFILNLVSTGKNE
jgi:hypothetical protein